LAATGDDTRSAIDRSVLEQLLLRSLEMLNSPGTRARSIPRIASLIAELAHVDAVGIRLMDGEDFPYRATVGFEDRFVESERCLCRRGEDGRVERDAEGRAVLECLCGSVIRGCPPGSHSTPSGSFYTACATDLRRSEPAPGFPPVVRNRCSHAGYESIALIPLRHHAKTIGLLQIADRRPGLLDGETIAFLEGLGAGIGLALGREIASGAFANGAAHDSCDLDRRSARDVMRIQRDLAVALAEASSLTDALERCLDTALEATAYDSGAVHLPDREQGGLRLVCSRNLGDEFRHEIAHFEAGTPPSMDVARGEPVYRPAREFNTPSHGTTRREAMRSAAILPVRHEGRIVACLSLGSHELDQVSATDRLVAESIAAQMGGIISRLEAIESLRESEKRYRATIEATTDMMHVIDRRMVVDLCNDAFRRTLTAVGHPAEPIGAELFSISPFLPGRVRDEYEAVFAGGEPLSTEERTEIAGQGIWTETRKIPIRDESGEVGHVLTIVRDVTARKRDELRLRVQRDLAQKLSEVTSLDDALSLCIGTALQATVFDCGGVYLVDEGTGALDLVHAQGLGEVFVESARRYEASSASARLVMAGEPVYRGLAALGGSTDAACDAEGLRAKGVLPVTHEDRVVACMNLASHTAEEIPVTDRLVAESIAAQMGGIIARLGAVDSLRRSEQREGLYASGLSLLARSAIGFLGLPQQADVYEFIAEQVSELVSGAPVVVCSYASEGGFFQVRSVRNLDLRKDELRQLIGRDLEGLEVQLVEGTVERLLSSGLVTISVDDFSASTGPLSPETAAAISQRLGIEELRAIGLVRGGELYGVMSFVIRDGDEPIDPALVEAFAGQASVALGRRRSEEDKLVLEEFLSHAHKMEAIGTLAAGVAHDFNNLLTGVLGHAYMLKGRHQPGTTVFKSAETIETAALRASELTKQLLGFARRGKRQEVQVDVHQLVDDVMYFLEHTIDKRIDLVKDACAEPLFVRGDPSQLQAVILNLAVNARDAMPEGGEMRFVAEPAETGDPRRTGGELVPGSYLRLSVADTGHGMSDAVRDRIFEPFFTTKKPGKGTGMGLAMVYGVVRDHGGWIDVKSRIDEGTTFDVYLPRFATTSVPRSPRWRTEEPIAGKGRVLVVDDERALRKMFQRLLEKFGYTVTCVENGEQAVEEYRIRGDEIDVVILDLVMPVMNGSTCYRFLKELDPGVRVIVATGNIADEAIQDLIDDGVSACIEKPVLPAQLAEVLSDVLGTRPE